MYRLSDNYSAKTSKNARVGTKKLESSAEEARKSLVRLWGFAFITKRKARQAGHVCFRNAAAQKHGRLNVQLGKR